jgi:hypothetical protein
MRDGKAGFESILKILGARVSKGMKSSVFWRSIITIVLAFIKFVPLIFWQNDKTTLFA